MLNFKTTSKHTVTESASKHQRFVEMRGHDCRVPANHGPVMQIARKVMLLPFDQVGDSFFNHWRKTFRKKMNFETVHPHILEGTS